MPALDSATRARVSATRARAPKTPRRRRLPTLLAAALIAAALIAPSTVAATAARDEEGLAFFEEKVRPVLARNCYRCHDGQERTAGLDLTSAAGFVAGSDAGAIVSPDNPASSRLLEVLSYEHRVKMPPGRRLPSVQLADVRNWVEMGAPWPGADAVDPDPPAGDQGGHPGFTEEERAFWFFQPLTDPEPPAVQNEDWVRTPIDRFILAELESRGLEPAGAAPPATLLRRASYNLTGLPPSPEDVRRFLGDPSEAVYRREIERFLASPRHGERYGRHWLDVARYADSTGNDEDHRYPYAYRYRDYVIDAFNEDLPYDRFVTEQLAGDLLPPPPGEDVNRRGIVATGFLALGPKAIAQQDKTRMMYDVWDEQVDVVSRAFMGLTVACARCHDHKFDPIPTKDYYGLVGIFASTRSFEERDTHVSQLLFVPLVGREEHEVWQQDQRRIRYAELAVRELTDTAWEHQAASQADRIADYMMAAWSVYSTGADTAAVAAGHNLDRGQLERWAKYLAPREEIQPHLVDWWNAADAERQEIAESYQRRFADKLTERREELRDWRIRTRAAALRNPLEKPPTAPIFQPGRARFYAEVSGTGGPLGLTTEGRAELLGTDEARLLEERRARLGILRENEIERPDAACAVTEGEPVDQHVLLRGDYSSPGERAPKIFPSIVAGTDQEPVTGGSGRRELAAWLTTRDNPLTARVMVNRIWSWHFGEGLVRSPDNFGRLGDRPSHPELLDWLASRFVESGWSMKELHRLILHSSVYRTSSVAADRAYEEDPSNRLLTHFPRRRLAVEEIRDGLLQIDGSLDLTMGGTLQEGFGTDSENSDDRLSLKPEDYRRRTVYLPLRRANLPSLMNLFDFGDAVTPQGKRQQTNVAPQALFMMNSAFVHDRAHGLAERILAEEAGDRARAELLYLYTISRPPGNAESKEILDYVEGLRSKKAAAATMTQAWASAARVLLASNELMYVD